MPDLVDEIAERALSLSTEDRVRLVDLLLAAQDDSDSAEAADAWDREIVRRIAAHKAGEVEAYDLQDVLAEARRLAP